MKDLTTSTIKDSTINNNTGTKKAANEPIEIFGKIEKAQNFDGVDDNIIFTDPAITDFTIEAFIKADTIRATYGNYIVVFRTSPNDDVVFGIYPTNQVYWQIQRTGQIPRRQGTTDSPIATATWYHLVLSKIGDNDVKVYINGVEDTTRVDQTMDTGSTAAEIGGETIAGYNYWFDGIIDEVRISSLARSDAWLKASYHSGNNDLLTFSKEETTALSVKKEVSPYSIRQYGTITVTIQIKNSGASEIKDIQIMDSIHPSFDLISGDFPNPKKYDIIRAGESREIQYIAKAKESGSFTLDSATVTYADREGNIQEVKSEPVSIKVIPSSESTVESNSPSEPASSAVLLHGEKTDVVLGEDILLKLSAVNLITKPPMSVQVMIYPPSGMSVTGSEFVKSGAGIYTTTYTLNPGDGKDIEVHIKSNQVGDFNVKGRIVYYFGEDKDKAEDHTLNLPIKVRKEPGPTAPAGSNDAGATQKAPGFAGEMAIIGILSVTLLIRKRGT